MDNITNLAPEPISVSNNSATNKRYQKAEKARVFYQTRLIVVALVTALFWAIFASGFPSPAQAAEKKYAAFVMHADSGDVLFDRYSTLSRYPASLTKMMTLYLLFEELESGRLTLKSKLKVSRTAAGQPPSKLGVRSGGTITVEDAIKALIVKSANDVAVVVAEKIGGSEWRFARKMTAKSRKLGMHKTTFRNASGLPNSRQRTTARDMAELGRRLYQDFPQYRHYLNTKKFTWKNRTYTTHNSLVKNYQGADGIKTGYTRSSGFNLTTTATRDGQRLIGVVLGGRSSRTRDKHMREILDKAFAQIATKPTLISALHRNPPTPRLKSYDANTSNTLLASATLSPSPFSDSTRSNWNTNNDTDPLGTLIAGSDDAVHVRPFTTAENNTQKQDKLGSLISQEISQYEAGEGDIDETAVSDSLNWSVQIGAYSTQDYAHTQLERAAHTAKLDQYVRQVIPLDPQTKSTLYRARFFFPSQQEAIASCNTLKSTGIGCFVSPNSR